MLADLFFIYITLTKTTLWASLIPGKQKPPLIYTPPTHIESSGELEEESESEADDAIIIEWAREPAYNDAHFFEELLQIDGQNGYIAHPIKVEQGAILPVVLYAHGSNSVVSANMDPQFMKDLREYGKALTEAGYIFAASNMHGENWGNDESIEDMRKLLEYIHTHYPSQEKINIIGFSMGGLPAIKYTYLHPGGVNKLALLAPTSYATSYSAEKYKALSRADIKIWHGSGDKNVPLNFSEKLVQTGKRHGVDIDLVRIDGATHWDVDVEYISEIVEFFSGE